LHRSKNPAAIAHSPLSGRGGRRDEAGGVYAQVRRAVYVEGISQPEAARCFWDRSADGGENAGVLRAAATSWHSNKFLNPITDGAVLRVLHLTGYKINNPTLLARISHEELEALFVGYGYTPYFVEGSDPQSMHQNWQWPF